MLLGLLERGLHGRELHPIGVHILVLLHLAPRAPLLLAILILRLLRRLRRLGLGGLLARRGLLLLPPLGLRLELPKLALVLLPLRRGHVFHGLLLRRGRGLTGGAVVQCQVAADRPLHRPREEVVAVESVLHAEHLHVGPQRHLAEAVAVEIELVLLNVIEVLSYGQVLLQRLAVALLAHLRVAVLDLVPHALHVVQVVHVVAVFGEEHHRGLRLRHLVRAEHPLGADGVEVPVCEVHLAPLVSHRRSPHGIPAVLEHARLEQVRVDRLGRLLDGIVDDGESLAVLAHAVVMLRQKGGGPHDSLLVARVAAPGELLGRLQGLLSALDDAAEGGGLVLVGVEGLEIRVERGDALLQRHLNVLRQSRLELRARKEIQGDAAGGVGLGELLLVAGVEGRQLRAGGIRQLLEPEPEGLPEPIMVLGVLDVGVNQPPVLGLGLGVAPHLEVDAAAGLAQRQAVDDASALFIHEGEALVELAALLENHRLVH
mmetsp:Transcript_50868/g.162818  ORF Transcript_50868/g.162818 Transcript_50868/m.162818 type:complete len:486 (-) Transcript_50868:690-2147(-)